MKTISDQEYKRIYVNRIANQLNNNSKSSIHINNARKIRPKTTILYTSPLDQAYKARYLKTLQSGINLHMLKDKSSEDIQMGIVPPVLDNRTTGQKIADTISMTNTANTNAQLLFRDSEQANEFTNWLLLQDVQMTIFFNEHFSDIKTKFV